MRTARQKNSNYCGFIVPIRDTDCRPLGAACFRHRRHGVAASDLARRRCHSSDRRNRRQVAPLLPRRATSGQTPNMAPDDRQELPVNRRDRGATHRSGRLPGLKLFNDCNESLSRINENTDLRLLTQSKLRRFLNCFNVGSKLVSCTKNKDLEVRYTCVFM